MEELHELLVNYNSYNIKEKYQRSWSKQFCEPTFPIYWQKVFEILRYENREQRVVEIGCGQGDVTSIFCHLGFKNIKAFERDTDMAEVAKEKIATLFSRNDVIVFAEFPQSPIVSDILVLVNCAYDDGVKTKEEYLRKLQGFYDIAGTPALFILEVIDSSYIAAIMAQLLVDPSEDVRSVTCYDPSAGTGTLVIALAHAIGEQNCTVYTQDISDKSSTMMMLNLILNSMSHSLTHVIQGNTLKHPFHKNEDGSLRKFGYIVSNPPFKLDFSDYHSDLKTDSYKGRFFAGIPNIPSKNKKGMEIYLCFFQHLLYSLKEDGKAAIVVPTGFITAKSGIAFKIRKHLVDGEKSILRGVVSMPSNIFANTGTNVSVVFIDKSGVDKPVLIDASKLGETIKENGNQKTKLRTEEIQQIVNTFRNKEVVEDFSVTPTFDEIKEKGYSFSAGQYFDIKIDYVDITEDEFNRRMDNFKTTLRQQFSESHRLEEEIMKQLDCIGFNENVGKE